MSLSAVLTHQGQNSPTFTPLPFSSVDASIPQAWDHHLIHSPDHSLFVYEDLAGNTRRITWSQSVRAFHRVARLVQGYVKHSPGPDNAPVVGILASTDTFTFAALICGIVRAGYRAFPISIRNSPVGIAHLLSTTSCSRLFVSSDPAMAHLCHLALEKLSVDHSHLDVHTYPVPLYEDLYDHNEDTELLPPISQLNMDTTAIILHSSGSTSFPKPIPLSHRVMLQWGNVPYHGEVDLCGQIWSCHSVPMFHAMGVIQLCWATIAGFAIASFRSQTPYVIPTSDNVLAGAIATGCNVIMCVPAFVETWSRDESLLSVLKSFNCIVFAGASLQQRVGDLLSSKGVRLCAAYGTTEVGCLVPIYPAKQPAEGWQYFKLSRHTDPRFVPVENNHNVGELVLLECPSHTPSVFNTTIDGRRAFATNDLLMRHPTNPDLYSVYGRADDQIMHSTGEKTNPGPLEAILKQDPIIYSAVMFGRERLQPGVLLDLVPEHKFDPADLEKLHHFRNSIWPTVEKANSYAPQHSRLFKEMIIVSKPEKPFEYTPKNTPRRHIVIANYDEEICAAYDAVQESSQTGTTSPVNWTLDETISFMRTIVAQVMQQIINDDADMFQNGCDSLQATWIRNTIMHALRQTSSINVRSIPHTFVYSHPSILALSRYIASIANAPAATDSDPEIRLAEKLREMTGIVSELTASFPTHIPSRSQHPEAECILLTGTTGAFGSYILEELLSMPSISKIYALNRPSTSGTPIRERQISAFRGRGVEISLVDSHKLILLEADTSIPEFGLSKDIYEAMRLSVTTIMHNAWRVDFNNALSSFRPNITGVRHLIDFALSSPLTAPPRFEFVSSIGVFHKFSIGNVIPETPILDGSVAVGTGYGESKWIAERILEIASEQTPLKPIIVRVGQLAGGSRNGAWSTKEWFPSLVKSGVLVHCLPDSPGEVSWIQADIAAKVFVEMRTSSHEVLHLVHPRRAPLSTIMQILALRFEVPLVPYPAWLSALETDLTKGRNEQEAASHNPALRLIEFFRAYAHSGDIGSEPLFSTVEAKKSSSWLGDPTLKQIEIKDVDQWLRYWKDEGFISI